MAGAAFAASMVVDEGHRHPEQRTDEKGGRGDEWRANGQRNTNPCDHQISGAATMPPTIAMFTNDVVSQRRNGVPPADRALSRTGTAERPNTLGQNRSRTSSCAAFLVNTRALRLQRCRALRAVMNICPELLCECRAFQVLRLTTRSRRPPVYLSFIISGREQSEKKSGMSAKLVSLAGSPTSITAILSYLCSHKW